jgi:hypothetical protein
MDDFLIGSMPSWLNAAASAISPLIALLVGFAGADRWLDWLLSEKCHYAAAEGDEAGEAVS